MKYKYPIASIDAYIFFSHIFFSFLSESDVSRDSSVPHIFIVGCGAVATLIAVIAGISGKSFMPQYWNWGSKSFLGYLSMHPLITLFSAYHILRTVNTKVLKLHIWLCLKEDRFIKTGGDFAMYSSNSIPHNSHFRVPCPNIILMSYINSSQFIPHSSHFAVRTLDFTVHTSHFTVHTSHVIVYTSQFIVQSS